MSRIRTWIVGREPGCDVVLRDDSVSRRHAEVVRLPDGRLHVTDRATTNGTFILRCGDWEAVRQTFLEPADQVRFGDCRLTADRFGALCPRDDRPPGSPPPPVAEEETLDDSKELVVDPETGAVREREPEPRRRRSR